MNDSPSLSLRKDSQVGETDMKTNMQIKGSKVNRAAHVVHKQKR